MASEKVKVYEQKKGFNWLWLLPLLLLIPLLWWMFGRDRTPDASARAETERTAVTPVPSPAPAGAPTAALSDLTPFYSAADRASYADRSAQLSTVAVRRVLSDRVFTVSNGRDPELFVMLDEKLDAGGAEQRVQIKEGQALSLDGSFEKPPSAETRAERFRGLNQTEADQLIREQVYLRATRVSAGR